MADNHVIPYQTPNSPLPFSCSFCIDIGIQKTDCVKHNSIEALY